MHNFFKEGIRRQKESIDYELVNISHLNHFQLVLKYNQKVLISRSLSFRHKLDCELLLFYKDRFIVDGPDSY